MRGPWSCITLVEICLYPGGLHGTKVSFIAVPCSSKHLWFDDHRVDFGLLDFRSYFDFDCLNIGLG